MSDILKNMDCKYFFQLTSERKKAIEEAAADKPKTDYPVNRLAEKLHPSKQFLLISKVKEHGKDCKTYTLVPNKEKGTMHCAVFSAGQYLSIYLQIEGCPITRPYSICSSPQDALQGRYQITVKKAPGGFASDYILEHWKEGDEVITSGPLGTFQYERLRDAKTVVGIAGGSGITPFLSLARAISEGDEDCNLILLYGSRTYDQILFKQELDDLEDKSDRVKVVHVLSHEKLDGYEYGFVTKELICKYAPNSIYSVFVCGPPQMYNFVEQEINGLGLEKKYVRYELSGVLSNAGGYSGYPETSMGKKYKAVVRMRDKRCVIECKAEDSLLVSLEKAGIAVPSHCRSGECGYCHSKLISGNVFIPDSVDYRRVADFDFGFIHPCCSFPISDIEIEIYPEI